MEYELKHFTREAEAEVEELRTGGYDISEEELRDRKKEIIVNKVAGAIASIADVLNGGDQKDVVEGMLLGLRTTHRYIQGQFWQGMLEFIKQTGDLDTGMNFDGRNEWTKDLCKRMAVAGWNPDAVNMEKAS